MAAGCRRRTCPLRRVLSGDELAAAHPTRSAEARQPLASTAKPAPDSDTNGPSPSPSTSRVPPSRDIWPIGADRVAERIWASWSGLVERHPPAGHAMALLSTVPTHCSIRLLFALRLSGLPCWPEALVT